MGIINNNAFLTRYGQELTNTYISLGNNVIELKKETEYNENNITTGKYILTGIFNIWLSKDARNNSKSTFATHFINKVLTTDEITSNLYNILYSEIKKKYANSADDL